MNRTNVSCINGRLFWPILLVLAFLSGGCFAPAQMPMVSDDGEIHGGHPRLADVVQKIKELRDRNALLGAGVKSAGYVAVIAPTPQASEQAGELPATSTCPKASYSVICASESLDEAPLCVAMEVLYDKEGKLIINNMLLAWQNGHWKLASLPKLHWRTP